MRSLFSSTFLLLSMCVSAQWAAPNVNTHVGAGPADLPMMANGPEGSTYISWFESVAGSYKVRMQRLDSLGVAMWPANGYVISDEPQGSALFRHDFTADNAGNALFAFQDERSGDLDLVVYKVGPDGSDLWNGGVEPVTPGGSGMSPVLTAMADDRVVVAWNGQGTAASVLLQVYSPEGVALLDEALALTATGTSGRPSLVPTSDGGFWVSYVHQTGNFMSPGTIKAKRFTADLQAGPELVVSGQTVSAWYFPKIVSDGMDGFYIGFNTGNIANQNMTDVYVQRMRANGLNWSTNGVAVEQGATTHRFNTGAQPTVLSDGATVVMAYQVTNSSQGLGGLSIQAFDTAGAVLNGTSGAVIKAQSSAMHLPYGTFVRPNGEVLVGYSTTAGFGNDRLEAVVVEADGTVVEDGELEVATVPSTGKSRATLLRATNALAVVSWQDSEAGGTIYAQGIPFVQGSGIGLAEQTRADVRLLGGEHPEILFGSAMPGELRLTVLDVHGRRIGHYRLGRKAVGERAAVPVEGLSAGSYLLVLESGLERITLRMVR